MALSLLPIIRKGLKPTYTMGLHRLFIFMFGLGLSTLAHTEDLLVLLSSDAKPYKDAQVAAQERLGKKGLTLRTLQIKDLTDEKLKEWQSKPPLGILAIGTEAALAVHEKSGLNIPLFFCMVADPDGQGLTQGRAMQGVTIDVPLVDQFALIEQALPKARSLGLLYQGKSERGVRLLKAVKATLPPKFRLEAVDMDRYESSSKAIEALLAQKVDVVWTSPDASVYQSATVRTLLLSALREKIPVFGFSKPFVKAGALVGVGIEPRSQGEQVADIVQRYMDGRSKSPEGFTLLAQVESPRFEIVLNLMVAEQISVRVADSLIKRASDTNAGGD